MPPILKYSRVFGSYSMNRCNVRFKCVFIFEWCPADRAWICHLVWLRNVVLHRQMGVKTSLTCIHFIWKIILSLHNGDGYNTSIKLAWILIPQPMKRMVYTTDSTETLQWSNGPRLCPFVWLPYAPDYFRELFKIFRSVWKPDKEAQCGTIGPNTYYRQEMGLQFGCWSLLTRDIKNSHQQVKVSQSDKELWSYGRLKITITRTSGKHIIVITNLLIFQVRTTNPYPPPPLHRKLTTKLALQFPVCYASSCYASSIWPLNSSTRWQHYCWGFAMINSFKMFLHVGEEFKLSPTFLTVFQKTSFHS